MKISLTVQSFITDTIFILNIPKENHSEKEMVWLVGWLVVLGLTAL